MRRLLLALLVSAFGFSAQAQEFQVAESGSGADVALERRVQKRLEALGYKEVQLEQDVLVVRAKDEFDKAIVLLVDPDTLFNLKIYDPEEEPSTTGSGPSQR